MNAEELLKLSLESQKKKEDTYLVYTIEDVYNMFVSPLLRASASEGERGRAISRWELRANLPKGMTVSQLTRFATEEKGLLCHEYADVVVFTW